MSLAFGYEFGVHAKIGISWVFPSQLSMESGSRIGSLNFFRSIDRVQLGRNSNVGALNWITGFSTDEEVFHFKHVVGRKAQLLLGDEAAITSRHIIDCTDSVEIGDFSTVGGYRSQLLTHSIDFENNRQSSRPITIGKKSFIGSGSVFLPGARVADFAIVAAGSVVVGTLGESHYLYGGVPARPLKPLSDKLAYFRRTTGRVD
jgi:acetyltransferase-like isoleucine patch superfamily enzyme